MPNYTYQCNRTDCGKEFEEIVMVVNRNDIQECPHCKFFSGELKITGVQHTPSKWGDTPRQAHKKHGFGPHAG
jgi:putative FmdB family regulatory protein